MWVCPPLSFVPALLHLIHPGFNRLVLMKLLASLFLAAATAAAACDDDKPTIIIGVAQQSSKKPAGEYIAASYVKWLETAGARVVPIPYHMDEDALRERLEQLNGLVFPGGSAGLTATGRAMYALAKEFNDDGIYFPLWGTCLGYEWMLKIESDENAILDSMDAWNISSVLAFQGDAVTESRLFGSGGDSYAALADHAYTMNNHRHGIFLDHWESTDALTAAFNVLATSDDREGATYVAAIEGTAYPFYGVQFHPEKNEFERGVRPNGQPYEAIDHSDEAISIARDLAAFFVAEASKNNRTWTLETPPDWINDYPTTTAKAPGFELAYMFPSSTESLEDEDEDE
ncbi:Aste57867_563 [Aphanomyces stellatus]|uniref:folate gamma-glutamyl hydrolase n=1 Tax=Aphanomyces stellatus TaxID=120398 RepID=A0A485K7Y2_9STRA|nr:hypothetical protein As57867_000562 [Aphanomyces stellatus]VFT77788.1 Aste57867_563 [Aphanomyces stellatus]